MDVDVERRCSSTSCSDYVERTFRQLAERQGPRLRRRPRRRACRRRSRPTRSGCSRCSRTCCRTRSSSPSRARSTCTIDVADRRAGAATSRRSTARAARDRLPRDGHRHRHPGRQAADHLRGVPAGRRHHQPQVRRHRPRPLDQPRDRAPARRRDQARRAQVGQGSSFTLYLPADVRPRAPATAAAPRRRDRRAAGAAGIARPGVAPRRAGRSTCDAVDSVDRPTTAATSRPGDKVLLDRRGRSQLRADPARCGARARVQGAWSPCAATSAWRWREAAQARRDHARHRPAGARRLDGARSPEARPGDAAHPGAHHLGHRRSARGAEARRHRAPRQAGARRRRSSAALTTIGGFVERTVKNLLVVEDDDVERNSIVELIGNGDVHTTAVGTGEEALAALERTPFDCMVLDLGLQRHDRLRAAREDAGQRARSRRSRSSSTPARS